MDGSRERLIAAGNLLVDHINAAAACRSMLPAIVRASEMITKAIQNGHKVLLCGNGGSAADAQHIAAELLGRFKRERRALPAIALHGNASAMTAIANDYDYQDTFSRILDGLGRKGDVLVAISTSGNSPNVIRAAEMAEDKGIFVIGLTGAAGGRLKSASNLWIGVPSEDVARIQELHIFIGHTICQLVEDAL